MNRTFGRVAPGRRTAGCGVVPGSLAFVGVSIQPNINLPLAGFGCSGGTGTLIINPTLIVPALFAPYTGAPAVIPFPVPDQDPLYGAVAHAQVLFLTPSGALRAGSAVNLVIGIAP